MVPPLNCVLFYIISVLKLIKIVSCQNGTDVFDETENQTSFSGAGVFKNCEGTNASKECHENQQQQRPTETNSLSLPLKIILIVAGIATAIIIVAAFCLYHRQKKIASSKKPSVLIIYSRDNKYHEDAVHTVANYLQQYCQCNIIRYVVHHEQEDPDCRLANTIRDAEVILLVWSDHSAATINADLEQDANVGLQRSSAKGIRTTLPVRFIKEWVTEEMKKEEEDRQLGRICNLYFSTATKQFISPRLRQLPRFKLFRDCDYLIRHIRKLMSIPKHSFDHQTSKSLPDSGNNNTDISKALSALQKYQNAIGDRRKQSRRSTCVADDGASCDIDGSSESDTEMNFLSSNQSTITAVEGAVYQGSNCPLSSGKLFFPDTTCDNKICYISMPLQTAGEDKTRRESEFSLLKEKNDVTAV